MYANLCSQRTTLSQSYCIICAISLAAVQLSEHASRTLIALISQLGSHVAIQTSNSNIQSSVCRTSHVDPPAQPVGHREGLGIRAAFFALGQPCSMRPRLTCVSPPARRRHRCASPQTTFGFVPCFPVKAFASVHLRSLWPVCAGVLCSDESTMQRPSEFWLHSKARSVATRWIRACW